MRRLIRHLTAAFRRDALDDQLRDELSQHVDWKARGYSDAGLEPHEARRRAALDVGNVTRLREEARDMWGFPTLDSITQDLHYGIRLLRRSPGFSAVAILSLAVGIGASAAVFSLADTLLFRKLAVANPDSLVVMKWASGPAYPFSSLNGYAEQNDDGLASTSFSQQAFDAFRTEGASHLDTIGFADLYQVNLAAGNRAELGTGYAVSGNYFGVLGIQPSVGRLLNATDDRPGASPAVVISHAFWTRRFGADPDAIGKVVSINAVPFTVAGILPEPFHGTGQAGTNPDVYMALAQRPLAFPEEDPVSDPNYWWVLMMGRLKPGVQVDDARAALDLLLKRAVAAAKPELAAKDRPRLNLLPGSRGQVEDRAQMRTSIVTMAGVTSIVLLVACANVAHLLLARGRARVRELSVRVAIGAPRRRVVRQLFTEAALLAASGSVLGLVLARWIGEALLPALASPGEGFEAHLAFDWRLTGFVVLTAGGSAIIFGLLPALRSTDSHLAAGLEETRRGLTAVRQRRLLSGGLVAVQIALSLLLLTGAGLLVRSVRNLQHVPLGFDPANLLLFRIDPSRNGYDSARTIQFYTTLLERLRATPGVAAAGLADHRLISNSSSYSSAMRADEVPPDRDSPENRAFARTHGSYLLTIDGQFFTTMRIPMLRGRSFEPADAGGEPVAVINRMLAVRLFGTEDVVGRMFKAGTRRPAPSYRIIGVCADARYTSLRRPIESTFYLDYQQVEGQKSPGTFAVRTIGDPVALASTVRELVRQLDSTLPVAQIGTQAQQIETSVATERLFARLASLLGMTALALCAIGLYGLLAYAVLQRTPEIGIRMALGAAMHSVRWMVLRESLVLVGIGLLAGVPAALAGTRILDSLLFELPPRDPATLGLAIAFMVGLALLAAYIPARRASRVDPLEALRAE